MTGFPVDRFPTSVADAGIEATVVCPECGSFLDAPRVNPLTDREGRKCLSCHDWQPVVLAAPRPEEPGSGVR